MLSSDTDTICAIATPPGRSGVGIVRISGPGCKSIAKKMLGFVPQSRYAHYADFLNTESEVIDKGLALFFESPNSFTGEDVLELQGHGGVFVLNSILKTAILNGSRLARPGEFSERSFVNSKMDLAQLEAVADLIDASTEQAAKSAIRTLEGDFSRLINELVVQITALRVFLEAAIDFTEEEIDFLSDGKSAEKLRNIRELLESVHQKARQGSILREGMKVSIAGKPNAGKSSLLNALSGRDSAIVTDIAGTTRDVLTELIDVDGIPVHIIDTAGLRDSQDVVEKEGVRRARRAIEAADLVLLVIDSSLTSLDSASIALQIKQTELPQTLFDNENLVVVFNKIDLLVKSQKLPLKVLVGDYKIRCVAVSAKTGTGIDSLRDELKNCVGFNSTEEGSFIARERHLNALHRTGALLDNALLQLSSQQSPELVAEDLRIAQQCLGEITGEFSSDDLLGEIFSNFCVGK